MEKILPNLEALQAEAASFIDTLPHAQGRATLVTLSGELGAGKTSFVQSIARALGITESVTSPTFVLEKLYKLPDTGHAFTQLVHIDAYRLESAKALEPLGFDELYADSGNLIVLEWPERVADAIPPDAIPVQLTVLPDNTRKITYA